MKMSGPPGGDQPGPALDDPSVTAAAERWAAGERSPNDAGVLLDAIEQSHMDGIPSGAVADALGLPIDQNLDQLEAEAEVVYNL